MAIGKPTTTSKASFAQRIDNIVIGIGKLVAWSTPVLMILVFSMVVARYLFSWTSIPLEELQWYLYAIGVMMGMSYAQARNTHIRIDIFYQRFSPRGKALVNLLGTLVLLLPFSIIMFVHGSQYFYDSWSIGESSSSSSGLPYLWIIKAMLPLSFLLLIMTAVSTSIKQFILLVSTKKDVPHDV